MKKLKAFWVAFVSLCLILSTMVGLGLNAGAEGEMTADIIDIDYSTGSAANKITEAGKPALVETSGNTAKIQPDMVMGREVAAFDSNSGYGYTLPKETIDLIAKNGYTVELMFKVTDGTKAFVFGDMYGNNGFGLDVNSDGGHGAIYYQKNKQNDNYRQAWYNEASDKFALNKWIHAVLTCNTQTQRTEMYINGVLYDYSSQNTSAYELSFPSDGDQVLYIGGNSNHGNFGEGMRGSVAYFKMYSKAASAADAEALAKAASENGAIADIFCADYSDGSTAQQVAGAAALIDNSDSTVKLEKDETLNRKVASFDGASGLGYKMTEADYAKMQNGYTFEAMIKLNELPATTNQYGSSIIGCMDKGSGFGLMGTYQNSMHYQFGKKAADGNYRQLWLKGSEATPVETAKWMHVMVTYDGGTYYYYVNGEQNDYVTPGEFGYLTGDASVLYVGGKPDENGAFSEGMKGSVSYVKIYSKAFTAEQVKALSDNANKATPADVVTGPSTENYYGIKFEGDFDSDNVVINFAAMSDIHIKATESNHDTYFVNYLKKAKELAGGSDKLAAVLVAGDLGDAAPLKEYPRIKQFLDANLDPAKTAFLPAIGNHDAYFDGAFSGRNSFRDILGNFVYQNPVEGNTAEQITRGNYHTVINGIHFISVYGIDGNHDATDLKWLDGELKKAEKDTPNMPIVVYSHVQPKDTVIDDEDDLTESRWYSTTIGPIIEKYSNVVYFAGHSHATPDIWRNGGYVSVGTGCGEKDMMFVQIDKNGNTRINVYSSEIELEKMISPAKVWTFANNNFTGSIDEGGENNGGNNGGNNNNNNNGDKKYTGIKNDADGSVPKTGETLPYTATALLCLSAAAVVFLSREKKLAANK